MILLFSSKLSVNCTILSMQPAERVFPKLSFLSIKLSFPKVRLFPSTAQTTDHTSDAKAELTVRSKTSRELNLKSRANKYSCTKYLSDNLYVMNYDVVLVKQTI